MLIGPPFGSFLRDLLGYVQTEEPQQINDCTVQWLDIQFVIGICRISVATNCLPAIFPILLVHACLS